MFDLVNIFDTFLPQLLLYPNPADPLNPNAATMLKDSPEKYEIYVREHVKKNANDVIILDKTKEIKTSDNNGASGIGSVNNFSNEKASENIINKKSSISGKEKSNIIQSSCDDDKKSEISEASVGDLNDENWD